MSFRKNAYFLNLIFRTQSLFLALAFLVYLNLRTGPSGVAAYSVAQAYTSIVIGVMSLSAPILIQSRFRHYSLRSLQSIAGFGVVVALPILFFIAIFREYYDYHDALKFAVIATTIRLAESIIEIKAASARSLGRYAKLQTLNFARVFAYLIATVLVSCPISASILIVTMLAFFVRFMKKNANNATKKKIAPRYWKLVKRSRAMLLLTLFSSGISVLPKILGEHFVGAESLAEFHNIFYLVVLMSYFGMTMTQTFWSHVARGRGGSYDRNYSFAVNILILSIFVSMLMVLISLSLNSQSVCAAIIIAAAIGINVVGRDFLSSGIFVKNQMKVPLIVYSFGISLLALIFFAFGQRIDGVKPLFLAVYISQLMMSVLFCGLVFTGSGPRMRT